MPDGVNLRFNQSPTAYRRALAKQFRNEGLDAEQARRRANADWDVLRGEFTAASRGDFEYDTLEETGRWFSSVGILGYSPTDWMASTFGHLRKAGVAPDEAYDTVRRMYTYGTSGRSSAELSTNFVFFPFSFQKKALGHLASHLSKDLSRAVLTHDMLKTYETLNERYDLESVWRDHLPAMERLQRFNLFAYGISPGELGGPNRPLIDAFSSTPIADGTTTPVLNLFLPQALDIKTNDDLLNVQRTVRRLLPVMNDVNAMVADVQSQGHVLLGGSGRTKDAEISRGYEEWNDLRTAVDQTLKDGGVAAGWRALGTLQNPAADRIRSHVAAERARIARENPAWEESRAETIANRTALDQEMTNRLAAFSAGEAWDSRDEGLFRLHQKQEQIEASLAAEGISLTSNPEDVPPEIWTAYRAWAIDMVTQYPGLELDWRKFFQRTWGPLERLTA